MEPTTEQRLRITALRGRRDPAAALMDARLPEPLRLTTTALAFLAVSGAVVGVRVADSASNHGESRSTTPSSKPVFSLPPLVPDGSAADGPALGADPSDLVRSPVAGPTSVAESATESAIDTVTHGT